MLEVAEALAEILRHAKPLAPAETPLFGGVLGRVLAENATADVDSPPFAKSLRDGYAVRSADCTKPHTELRIVAEIAAGAVPTRPVGRGECARIFTGAPMPEGADAVVMQEDTEPLGDCVRIGEANVKPRQWVFAQGAEMRAGEVVLPAGTVLNPAALGVLASIGRTKAELFPVPNVSVLATGNELALFPDEPLKPGQIRNSNGPMLAAQVDQAGAHPGEVGACSDEGDALRSDLKSCLDGANVLLVAGGVSVGNFDLVPALLEEVGVTVHFRQVRMKPGKPLLFGTKGDTLVFGLPGNPVSAFVCFELFVRPALRILAGNPDSGPRTATLPLAEAIAMTTDRPTYHPAKLELDGTGYMVRPLPWMGAPDLRGLQPADALLAVPPGETRLAAGQPISVVMLT